MRARHGENPRRKLAKKKAVKKKAATKSGDERQRGERRDFDDPDRAKDRCRAEVLEYADLDMHPVEQHDKGTRFHLRLQRAISRSESAGDKPRAGITPTFELADDVYRIMCEGLTRQHAESFLGLSERAIENWCARGKRDMSKLKAWRAERAKHRKKGWTREKLISVIGERPERTVYMYMRSQVLKADKFGEATLFGLLVDSAVGGDPKTAQWLLERRWPHLYGRFAQRTDLNEASDSGESKKRSSAAAILEAVGSALSED